MNRIIRTTAAILLPFAAGAIALSAAGTAAHADSPTKAPKGPVIVNPTIQPPKPQPPKPGPTDIAPAPQQPTGGPTDIAPAPQQPKDDPTDWAPAPVNGNDGDEPVDPSVDEPAPAGPAAADDSTAPATPDPATTGAGTLPGTTPPGMTAPTTITDVIAGTEPTNGSDRVESDAQVDSTQGSGIPVALYAALGAGLLGLAAFAIILAAKRRRV